MMKNILYNLNVSKDYGLFTAQIVYRIRDIKISFVRENKHVVVLD
jgi:uncharacterized protein Usg